MKVRFTRSVHNVTFEEITTAAHNIGLRHAQISLEEGPNGTQFWLVEADEELEVLMDVSVAEEEVPVA